MNLVRRPFRLTRIFGQVCREQGLASAFRLTALKCRGAFSSSSTSSTTDRSAAGLLTELRNDIADPPCTDNVQDGVQKGEGVVIYNTEHCSRELSVIPSIPMTP